MRTLFIPSMIFTFGCLMATVEAQPVVSPYPATSSGVRLTPPVSKKPAINGAGIVGAVLGKPVLFRLPISGERPMNIQVRGLPVGMEFQKDPGLIRGIVDKAGDYTIDIEASNDHGTVKKSIILKVGHQASLTPPMGWNSWYCHSELISQDAVIDTARQMVDSGLADFGWSYVNIDDCWQGERGGASHALQSNNRFKNMKEMCDVVHDLGLKIGIYSTPWVSTYAGFRGGSSMNASGDDSSLALPPEKRQQDNQIFGRWPGLHHLKLDKVGDYWFFDKDAKQWSDWGFDYVKVDWKPNDVPTTKRIFDDLQAQDRAIILSLSNAAPYENMPGLSQYAQVTRTTGDIQDSWQSIRHIGFSQEAWQKFLKPGHWPDPDMLQIGCLGKPNQKNTRFEPTRLTPDEQYTQVSLWSLLSAPLLLSCDLAQMDDFTLGLLCNDAVIQINQDPLAAPAKKIYDKDGMQVWTKELHDGGLAVGVFNLNDDRKTFRLPSSVLGLDGRCQVSDLWKQKDLGSLVDDWMLEINPHGVVLMKFQK